MAAATYLGDGDEFQMPAGSAYTTGQIILHGTEVCVYVGLRTAVSGEPVTMRCRGRFTFPMLSTDTGSVGAKVYWDNTNNRLTTTSSGNTLCGKLIKAKLDAETTANIFLFSA